MDVQLLSGPLSEQSPCGEDLEQTPVLLELEAFRVFGQLVPLPGDPWQTSSTAKAVDWRSVRDKSLDGLQRSRDLRVLTHLAAAVLRVEGLKEFLELIPPTAGWLRDHPDAVYPLFDGDGIAQANTLAGLADPMAIVEPFRRTPFVMHRQAGKCCLRDLDLARGNAKPAEGEEAPSEAQLFAVMTAVEVTELESLAALVDAAIEGLGEMESGLRNRTNGAAIPNFDRLRRELLRLSELLGEQLQARGAADAPAAAAGADGGGAGAPVASGAPGRIASREDAIRALDAVAEYFRRNEPSSAVPLFVERAKRLVGRDFLEIISDVAPDAISTVRLVGGLRDE